MSLISATGLAKAYGAQKVFEGVQLNVPHRARIALVGPNGVGKTTLLRLLVGLERPDQGSIQRARELRVGYLPQEAAFARSEFSELQETLRETSLRVFEDLRKMEAELAELEAAMGDASLMESAMARYGPLLEAFERGEGYSYGARIDRVLAGLGFSEADQARPLAEFSGGERTRAMLARLLLQDPDLLVLDEPVNHLDVESIEWLEGWLREWPGAALLVSHDRYFLDRTIDAVWELSPLGIETYRGDYTAYAAQREARRSRRAAGYRAQQEHIRSELEYIRRNLAGQNARQARGRRKRLARLLRDGALAEPDAARSLRIDFEDPSRSGDLVLETRDLQLGYPEMDEPLYRVPDLALRRGERAALLGPIGAGKTTFLKTLLGEIPPLAGEVRLGASLELAYFAQAHEGLDPRRTVLQEIHSVDPGMGHSKARHWLAGFLFTGDDVEKPVSVLSGGERGRLALAKLTLEGANFLLLDEPTNHLDLQSQEVLQNALLEFPGTILLVSHDRYLIDALATQVWGISPQNQELVVVPGGYAEYLEYRSRDAQPAESQARRKKPERSRPKAPSKTGIGAVEERIEGIERALLELADRLEEAGADVDQVRRLGTEYAQLERELEAQLERWERLAMEEERP